MKAHRLLPAALFLACIGSLSTVRTRHGQLTFSGSDSTEELKETSNHNPQHGSYRQNLESNGIPNLEVTAQHSRKILQDRNSQFGLTVQVRLTAIQLLGSEVRVYVRLERQSDNIVDNTQASAGQEDELVTTWISWATAPERRLSLQTNNAWAGGDSLDGLERRFRSGEPPSFANHEAETSLVFNEEFSGLPQGVYRAVLLDAAACSSRPECVVIAYSSTKNLENGKSWMLAYANIEVSYGAVELGLRFTKCANGSPCMVPAHGVRVTTTQRDVRGVEISHQWTGGPWVVNENGYLVMGVFLSVRHLLHFSAGKFDSIEIRKDVEVDGESTAMTRNLGVLDITEQRALCNQIPNGAPYHEAINGGRSGLVPAKSGALFSPGMQCYWQIIPTQPVQEIHLQFLHMGQAFGDGCQLQVYTLNPSSEIQLVHDIHGLVQNKLKVSGSQVLLHFSASPTAIMDEAFYMAWTALDTGISQSSNNSWFDTSVATILFSTLAAVAYCIAALAAWKWWRQRIQQQEQEATRQATREAHRNEHRRHRTEGRRRRTRGLPVELVSRLPTSHIKLAEIERDGDDEPSCSICLCEYVNDDKVTWLPCSHNYHTACVASWLKNSLICPICKDNVKRSLLKTLSMYRELHRSGLAHDDTSMPEDRTLQGSDEPGPQMLELATIQPSGSAANQFNLEAGSEEEDASPSAAAAAHAIAHFRQTDPGSQQLPEQSNSASRIGDNQASGVQL